MGSKAKLFMTSLIMKPYNFWVESNVEVVIITKKFPVQHMLKNTILS